MKTRTVYVEVESLTVGAIRFKPYEAVVNPNDMVLAIEIPEEFWGDDDNVYRPGALSYIAEMLANIFDEMHNRRVEVKTKFTQTVQ